MREQSHLCQPLPFWRLLETLQRYEVRRSSANLFFCAIESCRTIFGLKTILENGKNTDLSSWNNTENDYVSENFMNLRRESEIELKHIFKTVFPSFKKQQ